MAIILLSEVVVSSLYYSPVLTLNILLAIVETL